MKPEYFRTTLSPSLKVKITQFQNATLEYAFIGSVEPERRDGIEEDFWETRYNLERAVMTAISKVNTGTQRL